MAAWARGRSPRRGARRAPPRANRAARLPTEAASSGSAPGLGSPGGCLPWTTPNIRLPSRPIFRCPGTLSPKAAVTFRAAKEKAAGESGVLLGSLQGRHRKGLLHQAEEQAQLTVGFVVVYLFL